jgi:hypothetical protein
MIEYFKILSGSWPLAVMFIALLGACVALYIIHWFKKSDEEDKAIRASKAVVVCDRGDG